MKKSRPFEWAALLLVVGAATLPRPGAAQLSVGGLAQKTAAEYRQRARFPEHSFALSPGAPDPVLAKHLPSRLEAAGPNGAGPVLTVWSSRVSVEYPEPAILHASLSGGVEASVTATVMDGAGDVVETLTYFDDGVTPDAEADDGIYSAAATLTSSREPELASSYMVLVTASLEGGELRRAVGGFLVSRPWAQLVGRYKSRVEDGNFVVTVALDVERAGKFHLEGTLYGPDDEPLGVAQSTAVLNPGRRRMRLEFHGLIFHDRKVAGPFRVGTLSLSTTGGMPNAFNELARDVVHVRRKPLHRFTATPFDEPGLLAEAARLESQAAPVLKWSIEETASPP